MSYFSILIVLSIVLSITTLVLIYYLYGKIDKRFSTLYGQINEIGKNLDGVKKLCLSLILLDPYRVSSPYYSKLTRFIDDYDRLQEWDEYHYKRLKRVERGELEEFEKKHGSENNFIPSDHLKRVTLNWMTTRKVCIKISENIDLLRQIFVEMLHGKISVQEADAIAKEKCHDIIPISHPSHITDYFKFEREPKVITNEVGKWYEDNKTQYWDNEKWKERLQHLREMEEIEKKYS